MKKRTYALSFGVALALLVLVFGVLEQAGYVLSGPYLVKGGVLEITQSRPQSTVFIDNKRIGVTDESGSATFTGIKPGTRDLIVASNNTWPWIFKFEIEPRETVALAPLQVNEETQGDPILDSDNAKQKVASQAFQAATTLPSLNDPLTRANTLVWVDGSTIVAQDGIDNTETRRTIFTSVHPIKNVFWYGARNDSIIVASHTTIFALDLRTSQVVNYLPIYSGSNPDAVADPESSEYIFVREGTQYLSIKI